MKKPNPLVKYLKLGTVLSTSIKERLFEEGVLERRCAECGQTDVWKGLPLRLQVDHIDGNKKNNTKGNLRPLCPNCHSQTDTFAGGNKGRIKEIPADGAVLTMTLPEGQNIVLRLVGPAFFKDCKFKTNCATDPLKTLQ